jgi:hypothetical protein
MPTPTTLNAAQSVPSITIDACSKMLEAAAKSCASTQPPSAPNWDAMANSFASLSTAIAWGSVVVAIMAFFGALTWGKVVTMRAEKEAREEAKKCAKELIDKWLADEAPGIIRERVDLIIDATLGAGNDAKAADDIGKEAG